MIQKEYYGYAECAPSGTSFGALAGRKESGGRNSSSSPIAGIPTQSHNSRPRPLPPSLPHSSPPVPRSPASPLPIPSTFHYGAAWPTVSALLISPDAKPGLRPVSIVEGGQGGQSGVQQTSLSTTPGRRTSPDRQSKEHPANTPCIAHTHLTVPSSVISSFPRQSTFVSNQRQRDLQRLLSDFCGFRGQFSRAERRITPGTRNWTSLNVFP